MEQEVFSKYTAFFEGWEITQELGTGSYGKVYEIERIELGKTYHGALKVITIPCTEEEYLDSVREFGEDAARKYYLNLVKKMTEEFAIMAKLSGHTNIVNYADHKVHEHENGRGWDIFIRMELLTPLRKYLNREKRISRRQVIQLGIDICSALEECRKYNIIHRDIKPDNILISDSGHFKLGDFGVSRVLEGERTMEMTRTGTDLYMAPELYNMQDNCDSRVDIYSLGIMLYQLLNANRMPFYPVYPEPYTHSDRELALKKRMSGKYQLGNPLNTADDILSEIILKACAYDKDKRYFSPTEMRNDLASIALSDEDAKVLREEESWYELSLDTKPVRTTISKKRNNKSFFRRHWPLVTGAVMVVLGLIIGGILLAVNNKETKNEVIAPKATAIVSTINNSASPNQESNENKVLLHITLTANEDTTFANYTTDKQTLIDRAKILAGEGNAEIVEAETSLNITIPWKEAFNVGDDIATIINACLNRPMEMYVVTVDDQEIVYEKIAREHIQSATVKSGKVDGVDYTSYIAENPDTEPYYIELKLDDEGAAVVQSLLDTGRTIRVAQDADGTYDNWLYHAGFLSKDNSRTVIVCDPDWARKNYLDAIAYNYEHPILNNAFYYDFAFEPEAAWETNEEGVEFGQYQCEESELIGPTVTMRFNRLESDEAIMNDVFRIVLNRYKTIMDILERPYSIGYGFVDPHEIIIKTTPERLSPEVIALFEKFASVDLYGSREPAKTIAYGFDTSEVLDNGNGTYSLRVLVDDYSIDAVKEASILHKRVNGQFYLGSQFTAYFLSSDCNAVITDGAILFDKLKFLQIDKIDEEHRYLLDLINFTINDETDVYGAYYRLQDYTLNSTSDGKQAEFGLTTAIIDPQITSIIESKFPDVDIMLDPEDSKEIIFLMHTKIEEGFLNRALYTLEQIYITCDFDNNKEYTTVFFQLIDENDEERCRVFLTYPLNGGTHREVTAVCYGGLLDSYNAEFRRLLSARYFFTIRNVSVF